MITRLKLAIYILLGKPVMYRVHMIKELRMPLISCENLAVEECIFDDGIILTDYLDGYCVNYYGILRGGQLSAELRCKEPKGNYRLMALTS